MLKHKLFVPAVTFLSGLLLWILFLLWPDSQSGGGEGLVWSGIIVSIMVAGIFYGSASACRRVTGGRLGNKVRSAVLLIMAIISWFQIGIAAAGILAMTSAGIAIMALKAADLPVELKR